MGRLEEVSRMIAPNLDPCSATEESLEVRVSLQDFMRSSPSSINSLTSTTSGQVKIGTTLSTFRACLMASILSQGRSTLPQTTKAIVEAFPARSSIPFCNNILSLSLSTAPSRTISLFLFLLSLSSHASVFLGPRFISSYFQESTPNIPPAMMRYDDEELPPGHLTAAKKAALTCSIRSYRPHM